MDFDIEELEDKIIVKMSLSYMEIARASLFIKGTPKLNGKNIGTIGEIEIENKDDGAELLKKCCEVLKGKGVKYIVGPMNRTTWNEYRSIKKSEKDPMFLMENVASKEVTDAFKKADFDEIHTYTSSKGKIKDGYSDEVLDELYEDAKKDGITIRNLNKKKAHEELTNMFEVAKQSFKLNPLYTDIKEEEFIAKYEKYIDLCDERLILIAEKNKKVIGFLFSMPNINMEKPDAKINAIILKTIAVKPEFEDYALGNIMLNKIKEEALELGYRDWIFAFMYKNNTSQRMSARNKAKDIREYSLFGKELK